MDEILVAIQDAANTIAAPNWADILGVCFSLGAVIVACLVAWRQNEISRKQTDIADKQNKIALFEKRLEIYEILSSCSSSARILKVLGENEDILKYLFIIFAGDPKEYQKFNRDEAKLYLSNCATILLRASFFFSEEIASYIIDISGELLILANTDVEVDELEKYSEKKQRYFEAVKKLDENEVFRSIKAEMKMI